jgi:hypothetical protein
VVSDSARADTAGSCRCGCDSAALAKRVKQRDGQAKRATARLMHCRLDATKPRLPALDLHIAIGILPAHHSSMDRTWPPHPEAKRGRPKLMSGHPIRSWQERITLP